jgi:hypothetical protein
MTGKDDAARLWAPEKDEVLEDAATSVGRTLEERWAMFSSIQRMVAATWEGLSEHEMRRRLRVGEELDPRPEPWWKNVRPEEIP